MSYILNHFDQGGGADSVLASEEFKNMRAPLSRAMADYSADTYEILAGEDESRLDVSYQTLVRTMRGLSEESENYAVLFESQEGYAAEQLAALDSVSDVSRGNDEWNIEARKIGRVYGAMNMISSDLILDIRDEGQNIADSVSRYGYHGAGSLVTGVPIYGDMAQRIIDMMYYEWSNDVNEEAELEARRQVGDGNLESQNHLRRLFDSWANVRGFEGSVAVRTAADEAIQSYTGGRQDAELILRPSN